MVMQKQRAIAAILSNVAFLTLNFLAFKFTGFGLGLQLKHRICHKATLDKKAAIAILASDRRDLILSVSDLLTFRLPM